MNLPESNAIRIGHHTQYLSVKKANNNNNKMIATTIITIIIKYNGFIIRFADNLNILRVIEGRRR